MRSAVQKRHIAVIGEHKGADHPFLLSLRSHPLVKYSAVDILKKNDLHKYDVILHFLPDDHDLHQPIQEKPYLFVTENVYQESYIPESLWREIVRVDGSMEEFHHKLGRLLELVALQKHRDELVRREHLFDRYMSKVDLTEVVSVASRIVQLVGESTRAKNVCWISGEMAQTWWSQSNRRKSMLSAQTLAELSRCVWWKSESGDLEDLMQRTWPMAGIGRDWHSGEMLFDEAKGCGMLRLVAENGGMDLGYILIDEPQRQLRSGRRLLRKLENYFYYALMFEENRRLVYIDDLTSLYNQRYLPLALQTELTRAEREEKKVSILFLDVDYFKSVNDARGHLVGSKILIELAKLIRASIRTYDYAFRYGGDEFVLILPNANSDQARLVAERLRSRIEKNDFLVYQKHFKITVSIGVATFPDHATSPEHVLQLADEAMYNAKRTSRNVVYIAS
jgi:diguanylate cyclase (GGDEF)-like protein